MQRFSIVERICGCPLFDKVWSWKEEKLSPSTPAKMIHLFSHFAKTMGQSHVTRIVFDTVTEVVRKPKKRHNYTSSRLNISSLATRGTVPGRSGVASASGAIPAVRQRSLQSIRSKPMEMWMAQNDLAQAALFIAPDDFKEDPATVVANLLDKFTTTYAAELTKLRAVFQEMNRDPERARMDLSMIPTFKAFSSEVTAPDSNPDQSSIASIPFTPGPAQVQLSSDMFGGEGSAPGTGAGTGGSGNSGNATGAGPSAAASTHTSQASTPIATSSHGPTVYPLSTGLMGLGGLGGVGVEVLDGEDLQLSSGYSYLSQSWYDGPTNEDDSLGTLGGAGAGSGGGAGGHSQYYGTGDVELAGGLSPDTVQIGIAGGNGVGGQYESKDNRHFLHRQNQHQNQLRQLQQQHQQQQQQQQQQRHHATSSTLQSLASASTSTATTAMSSSSLFPNGSPSAVLASPTQSGGNGRPFFASSAAFLPPLSSASASHAAGPKTGTGSSNRTTGKAATEQGIDLQRLGSSSSSTTSSSTTADASLGAGE